jgi:hypothetical protein
MAHPPHERKRGPVALTPPARREELPSSFPVLRRSHGAARHDGAHNPVDTTPAEAPRAASGVASWCYTFFRRPLRPRFAFGARVAFAFVAPPPPPPPAKYCVPLFCPSSGSSMMLAVVLASL